MIARVSRETISGPKVQPLLFRKYLREAAELGNKKTTRRLVTKDNAQVQPGTFDGIQWETGRVRLNQPQPELRAQCKFESGRVRVVSVFSRIRYRDVFYAKAGRFGSRKASTLTLEVRRVRVARLQDMTEQDALDEGVAFVPKKLQRGTPRETFAALWDELGGSWAANPWVWIYDFQGYNLNVDRYLADIRGL